MLINILLATLFISSGALIGVFTLSLQKKFLHKILLFLVSLSAGTLMGGAFLHLLPEAVEELEPVTAFSVVIGAYLLFFVIETLLHWHHCHNVDYKTGKHQHTLGFMNLLGDSVHNFIDGLIIAGAFLTDYRLGIITTTAVALHEIPQEISDFGVLIYSGFKERRALILNLMVAFTVVLGGLVGYLLGEQIGGLVPYLLPFAAGGFIYIATTDLVPQIKNQDKISKSLQNLAVFLVGILIMATLRLMEVH
jgi:zinc and cadmium transporter